MHTDILVPSGNESELVKEARVLGFKQVIFLYADIKAKPSQENYPLPVRRAILLRNVNEAQEAKKRFDLVIGPCQREFVENKNVDWIILSENQSQHDPLYQRRADLDDVMCAAAKQNDKTLVFNAKTSDLKIILGRILQDARMIRKYGIKSAIATFAIRSLEMRAPKDLEAFSRIIKLK